MTPMTFQDKADMLFADVIVSIESMAYQYDHEDPEMRMRLVQMQAGLGLATVLERQGLWLFLRTVFASIVIRYKYKGLVDV